MAAAFPSSRFFDSRSSVYARQTGFAMPRRSPLRTTLSHHRPRNADVAARIVASTGLSPPALVPHAGRIVAIERDRQRWHRLHSRFRGEPRVQAVLGDFRQAPRPRQREYEVVANLPFAHTSEAMRSLLSTRSGLRAAHLVMARDAAMRWGGFGEETLVSVLAKPWFEFRIALALRRRDFVPPPQTDGVLLTARRRLRPLVAVTDERGYARFVRQGFGRGRASARRNLAGALGYERFGRAARALGIEREARPGALSFEQWLGLWRASPLPGARR